MIRRQFDIYAPAPLRDKYVAEVLTHYGIVYPTCLSADGGARSALRLGRHAVTDARFRITITVDAVVDVDAVLDGDNTVPVGVESL